MAMFDPLGLTLFVCVSACTFVHSWIELVSDSHAGGAGARLNANALTNAHATRLCMRACVHALANGLKPFIKKEE